MRLETAQTETLEATPASVREYASASGGGDARRDDSAAVYRAQHDAVYRFLCNRIGDAHAAEDLAAEVFIIAMRKRPATSGAPLRAWLLRVASHKASHWIRANRRRLRRDTIAARRSQQASEETSRRQDDTDAIQRALLGLPGRHQHVLALFYFGRLSVSQIAQVERCSPGTVKSRLARARSAMRSALQQETTTP